MEPIKNILNNRKFNQPAAIEALKKYINENYDYPVSIKISKKTLVISVTSSSLANILRMRQLDIIRRCDLYDYKLVFTAK